MSITPGREAEFRAALEQAKQVVSQAAGFRGIEVHQGVERPSTFLLTLRWEKLTDHTEGFRGGPLFVQWRALIGPYFAEPPTVEHWEAV